MKEEAKLKAKMSKEEVKVLVIRVRTLEAEKLKLGFQCARKQQEADIQHTSRLRQEDRAEAAEQREQEAHVMAELQVRAAKEQLPALQAKLQQLIAEKLTLQGHVGRAWHEADVEHTKNQRIIAVLEKKVACCLPALCAFTAACLPLGRCLYSTASLARGRVLIIINVHTGPSAATPSLLPACCKKIAVPIWCEGDVMLVANGTTHLENPESASCKKLTAAGAVRIKWPADPTREVPEPESFTWSILQEAMWNSDKHLGWRFTAAELRKRAEACG